MQTKNMSQSIMAQIMGLFILFFVCVLLCSVPASAATSVPKLDAKITSKNILTLLKKYDPDGYYLVVEGNKYKGDYMNWFGQSKRIVEELGTAVHVDEPGSNDSHA